MPHVEMTVTTLREHGVDVAATDRGWRVSPGPIAARDVVIEPDLSNAAPFLAAALVTGGRVTVRDWPEVTTQPGAQLDRILSAMGAEVTRTPDGLQVTGAGAIAPLVADLGEVGELTPVLAALCALADGPSRLTGIGAPARPRDRPAAGARRGADAPSARGSSSCPTAWSSSPARAAPRCWTPTPTTAWCTPPPSSGWPSRACRPATRARSPRRCPTSSSAGRRCSGEPAGVGLLSAPQHDSRSDEDDVRVRPSRRGSRPRTRTRPAHADAVPGLVVAVDRGRMTVRVEGPDGGPVDVTTMRARELGKHGVVVGDRVRIVGDTSGRTDSLARIVTIEERTTSLRRTADDTDPTERIVVANADLLVIVTAVTDPEPALRLPRPLPGRRLRRRPRAAALPDQDRPRQPAAAARPVRRPGPGRRGDLAGGCRSTTCSTGWR